MSDFTVRAKSVILDEVETQGTTRCSNCGSLIRRITTSHLIAASLGYSKREHVYVTCANCGKKFRKRQWDKNIAEIAEAKRQEYKTSFFQRYGSLLIALAVVFGGGAYLLFSDHSEHLETVRSAEENFSKAYSDVKQQWYDNIREGDFLLASKEYNDPARVYQVKEIDADVTVLTAYDQYIDRSQYTETEDLSQLRLGIGNTEEIRVKTFNIRKGIIEQISDNRMNTPDGYIHQIKKAS